MSVSPLYALAKFPRVSSAVQRAKVARQTDDEDLYIAVSGASINHYVLQPSPKLVLSHSLPPAVTVGALEKTTDGGFAIGIWNKTTKKHQVQIISKQENCSAVHKEWDVDSRVLAITQVADTLIVVTENATVCYSSPKKEYEQLWKLDALYTTVFSVLIENNVTLLVEYEQKKNNLHLRLVSPESQEISSKIIETTVLNNLTFTYRDGTLTQFANGQFTMYKIPHFTVAKTLTLSQLDIESSSESSAITLQSPAHDRLLIAMDHELFLVNTNFGIVLSQITFAKSKLELLFAQTQTHRNKSHRFPQKLFGVVLKEHELSGVSFSLDSNILKDSMGKKKHQNKKISYSQVPSILAIEDITIDFEKIVNAANFDSALLQFLQAENDYYTEKDRVVDSKFMTAIVNHIFAQQTIPERATTYLLTHPLFPSLKDLLSRLRANPRLLRQAIVTGNVSIKELIQELNATENEEIFKDIITRLLEFPREKLDFKDLDSFNIVERIIQLNFGYELISLLIDASGLFTWNEELIQKLQRVLQHKIEALNSASNLAAVLDQVESKTLKTVTRIPVYSIDKLVI